MEKQAGNLRLSVWEAFFFQKMKYAPFPNEVGSTDVFQKILSCLVWFPLLQKRNLSRKKRRTIPEGREIFRQRKPSSDA